MTLFDRRKAACFFGPLSICVWILASACASESRPSGEPDGGHDTGTAADGDADADTDADTDTETDGCGDVVVEGDVDLVVQGDLAGLLGVTRITGNLNIIDSSLATVDGLDSLLCIDGHLVVENNYNWSHTDWLGGLCNLRRIGGGLILEYNEAGDHWMFSGVALNNLRSVGQGMYISSNLLASLDGLESLTSIGASLTIGSCTGLANVDGLVSLKSVGGDLLIESPDLQNLDGLANLTEFDGSLTIRSCSQLSNISGLAGLTQTMDLSLLAGLGSLTSLHGLHNIHTIGGNLQILNVDTITSLDGLNGVTSVTASGASGDLSIGMCDSLVTLQGLENLVSAAHAVLTIANDSSLKDVNGLENLAEIAWLTVASNGALENLDGLVGLKHIYGPISSISVNTSLTSIRGLHHLESVDAFVAIEDNPALPTCRVQAFIDYLHSAGWDNAYFIANNGPDAGCDEEPL